MPLFGTCEVMGYSHVGRIFRYGFKHDAGRTEITDCGNSTTYMTPELRLGWRLFKRLHKYPVGAF